MFIGNQDSRMKNINDKALVKVTDDVLDVKRVIFVKKVMIEIPDDILNNKIKDEIEKYNSDETKKVYKEGISYILSDNREYHEDELIVGVDNIRNFNLEKII